MFSFFRKKPPADVPEGQAAEAADEAAGSGLKGWIGKLRGAPGDTAAVPPQVPAEAGAGDAPVPEVPAPRADARPDRPALPASAAPKPMPPAAVVPSAPAAAPGRTAGAPRADAPSPGGEAEGDDAPSWLERLRGDVAPVPVPAARSDRRRGTAPEAAEDEDEDDARTDAGTADAAPAKRLDRWLDRLFGGDEDDEARAGTAPLPGDAAAAAAQPGAALDAEARAEAELAASRSGWMDRLRGGLRRTGSSLAQVFTGTQIDEALYEELETALLMADAGVKATEYLLADLRRRVKEARATEPAAVKALLADALAELLEPLEKGLEVGRESPTVMMVVGVNGAGKTTTIGKLTRHLAAAERKVLLAAADTFRAAAREQLAVWADRNHVEIVSQQDGDPGAVTYDAVVAGKARGCDVVIADTAGRLTTQAHLMEELKKIRRVIAKAQAGAPHEVLLVVDGNTGQNALSQVQAFDAALGLTGLVVTKLDGTAKGGVLAAIALWGRDRVREGKPAVPVYFIGVGEKLEDLQTFDAREFARALLQD